MSDLERARVYGVYIHKTSGKLALGLPANPEIDENRDWVLEKGQRKPHNFFRCFVEVYNSGTGNFFYNRLLRQYELLEEVSDINGFQELKIKEPISEAK